jgi:hypothetical protein
LLLLWLLVMRGLCSSLLEQFVGACSTAMPVPQLTGFADTRLVLVPMSGSASSVLGAAVLTNIMGHRAALGEHVVYNTFLCIIGPTNVYPEVVSILDQFRRSRLALIPRFSFCTLSDVLQCLVCVHVCMYMLVCVVVCVGVAVFLFFAVSSHCIGGLLCQRH